MSKVKKWPRLKLTKRSVDAIRPPAHGEIIVADADLTGFALRVAAPNRRTGKSRKTYCVIGRTQAHRYVKLKLGTHGAITADQARELAQVALGKLAAGDDLVEERRETRAAEKARLAAPTMQELAVEYLEAHARVHKRASSVREDESMLNRIILPLWGSRKADSITHTDVGELHRSLRATPHRANRTLSMLSKMFNLAVGWGVRPDNPARGVQRFQESPRQRFLKPDELQRLMVVLDSYPNRQAAAAVRLLLWTGARKAEVLGMRWPELALDDAAVWTKAASRTKQKAVHRLPLSPAAADLLRKLKAEAEVKAKAAQKRGKIGAVSAYVFPGDSDDQPLGDIKKAWRGFCQQAGIEGCRLHDLRHSHASLLAAEGLSLPVIGALLGHSSPSTTARYAHLADAPLRAATGAVADRLAEYAKLPPKVVPLKQ